MSAAPRGTCPRCKKTVFRSANGKIMAVGYGGDKRAVCPAGGNHDWSAATTSQRPRT
jgi:hypothetical protein